MIYLFSSRDKMRGKLVDLLANTTVKRSKNCKVQLLLYRSTVYKQAFTHFATADGEFLNTNIRMHCQLPWTYNVCHR